MANHIALPPFTIVHTEDASTATLKRLRVYVAIRPEDTERMAHVAAKVVSDHALNNDAVIMFFYFSAADAGKAPSEARAQYVRNGLRRGAGPTPLSSERSLHRFKLPNGVITVEAAREAVA
jgi:hypothetical protein